MKLIRATVEDVPRIEWCAKVCCAEHGKETTGGELNWEHYRKFWAQQVSAGTGAMFLYEDEGLIVAGVGVVKYQEILTAKWRARQIFIYVKPDYRGKASVRRMMVAIECWAREHNCHDVVVTYLESMPEKTESFYRRSGYRPLETSFVKEIKL